MPATRATRFEVVAWYRRGGTAASGLRFVAPSDRRAAEVSYGGRVLDAADTDVLLPLAEEQSVRIHLYADRSVLEVFIDGGRKCVTRGIEPLPADVAVEVFVHRGRGVIEGVIVWPLRSIW